MPGDNARPIDLSDLEDQQESQAEELRRLSRRRDQLEFLMMQQAVLSNWPNRTRDD
ncbi:MAG: hypothetical protein IT162_21185 [Bryobacterales bacterium]|nr:hypothetical protein [Bryobacterales bacterium]